MCNNNQVWKKIFDTKSELNNHQHITCDAIPNKTQHSSGGNDDLV